MSARREITVSKGQFFKTTSGRALLDYAREEQGKRFTKWMNSIATVRLSEGDNTNLLIEVFNAYGVRIGIYHDLVTTLTDFMREVGAD
jgi:hypothetical protein